MKFCALILVLYYSYVANANHVVKPGRKTNLVDLTHEIHEDIPRHPVYKPLIRDVKIGEFQGSVKYKSEVITLPTHYGTHMDAPCHVNGSWCLSDVPLERLFDVATAVIDVRKKIFPSEEKVEKDYLITVEDITDWEKVNGKIPDESLLLFLTGWPKYWNDSLQYLGGNTSETTHHPGLSKEGAEYLLKNHATIYGVGIDTVSIDDGQSKTLSAHSIITGANIYVLENLFNLEKLPPISAEVTVGVLKLGRGASGGPARVIARFSG